MEITIRRLSRSDVTQNYVDWLNDPEINKYLETKIVPQSIDDCEEYIDRMRKDPNQFHFGIFHEGVMGSYNSKIISHIGNCKLGPVNWVHRNADVSIFIGDHGVWGQGAGYQAIMLLLDFGFNILNLHRVNAHVYQGNERSERLFKKCGFREEGVEIDKVWFNGKYTNVINYGKLRESHDFGWKDSPCDWRNGVFRAGVRQESIDGATKESNSLQP
jgi:RimJ/RimL family protein N-acetyltransferase